MWCSMHIVPSLHSICCSCDIDAHAPGQGLRLFYLHLHMLDLSTPRFLLSHQAPMLARHLAALGKCEGGTQQVCGACSREHEAL